jgi:hypothetical protein
MKLYTEEQVKAMIEKSQYTGLTADFLILAAPSVQLPTDEEIEKANPFVFGSKHLGTRDMDIWELGAKWMRDKIQEQ